MQDNARKKEARTFEPSCRQMIRDLIATYGWTLLSEDELVERILCLHVPDDSRASLERLAKNLFCTALYEACRQTTDRQLRERGYIELACFVYRAAWNRWPDLAEDVTQRTLLLVLEQIDRCREPTAFLAFALNYLRWAYQQETKRDGHTVPLDPDNPFSPTLDQVAIDEPLVAQERLSVLQTALRSLPRPQQQTIVLKFFTGLSDEEIARHLNVSAGNVRVLRHRALQHLRQNAALRAHLTQNDDL